MLILLCLLTEFEDALWGSWSDNREDLTNLWASKLCRASSCAEKGEEKERDAVLVEKWGLVWVTEIIVLQSGC